MATLTAENLEKHSREYMRLPGGAPNPLANTGRQNTVGGTRFATASPAVVNQMAYPFSAIARR